MSRTYSRRAFLGHSGAALTAASWFAMPRTARAGKGANETVQIAVIGVNGRGSALAESFATLEGSRVAALCDVDSRALERAAEVIGKRQSSAPAKVADLRRVFDDPAIDAVVIAAPDHWHAPATIMACAAGKHVYVEKPASHNPREGELMVAAARKHNRVVQLGTQRRSMPGIVEAIDRLRAGEIGKVLFSRGWYNADRKPIGHGKPAPVPEELDYTLWQGPAPEQPYRDNVIHYNWHWFWNWGTGELGNNGIHSLDICRWGLDVDYPRRVSAGGGKYFFDDDQETPDTHVVTYDFGDKAITWEGRNWHRRGFEGSMFGIGFYGDRGSLIIDGSNYKLFDPAGKQLVDQSKGFNGHDPHLLNFLDAVRSGTRLNSEIEGGHKSTLLCHLGNIAYRTGQTLDVDAKTGRIESNPAAAQLWSREYRPGWEPQV
jgi:predicted dehydrogenase